MYGTWHTLNFYPICNNCPVYTQNYTVVAICPYSIDFFNDNINI